MISLTTASGDKTAEKDMAAAKKPDYKLNKCSEIRQTKISDNKDQTIPNI
jgi:hypothetical protein